MARPAIAAQNLSKRYQIGRAARHTHLRDALVELTRAPIRGLQWLRRGDARRTRKLQDVVWALRDVSFEVAQGEVLGIIGPNGGGKSTLLRVLSRITAPTGGRAVVHGRVGALLEVGTGFHPELTGRENVYLSGSLLGMDRGYMKRAFDEIIAFSGVERFIDTPVKRYSSGMYLRLAFAIAAHLKTDILIVDEVLAVGDAEFQKKCLGKVGEVSREGRTVLFVSHNMSAVLALCRSGVLLEEGMITSAGSVRDVVDHYTRRAQHTSVRILQEPGRQPMRFLKVRILDHAGHLAQQVDVRQGAFVEVEYEVREPPLRAQIVFELWNSNRVCVLCSTDFDSDPGSGDHAKPAGHYRARCFLPPEYLRPGGYTVSVSSSDPGVRVFANLEHVIAFVVDDTGTISSRLSQGRRGVISPLLRWTTERLS